MAPALSSSSFRLAGGQPRFSKSHRHRPFHRSNSTTVVFAKQDRPTGGNNNGAAFPSLRFGGRKEPEAQGEASDKSKPFFMDIDFGKLTDPKSLVPAAAAASRTSTALVFGSQRRKDPRCVFVAGAMGQAGVRISRTLLREGFSVRAGVPELAEAQQLARIAVQYKMISSEESKRLNAVESAFGDAESIAKAIGNATKVVVTIGRSEDGPAGEITTDDAFQVVRAAQLAGVGHVTVVYDTSSGLPGASTYNVLDGITSFFNNIFARSQAPLTLGEFLNKVAEETEVRYTVIKASLGDDDAAAAAAAEGGVGGLVLAAEGSAAVASVAGTGTSESTKTKVSKWQMASLVAEIFSNTAAAENKVIEASTSSSASSKTIEELLSGIPEDGRREAYREALAKAQAEEEVLAASQAALEAAEGKKRQKEKEEEVVVKVSDMEARAASFAEDAQRRAQEAGATLEDILTRAKGLGADFSWDKLSAQFAMGASEDDAVPTAQLATVRGQAKARSLTPRKAVVKQPPAPKARPKRAPEPRANPAPAPEKKTEVRKVFGGLFKQETIYIDDD